MKKSAIPGLVPLPLTSRIDIHNKVFIRRKDCPVLKKQEHIDSPDEHIYIGYYDPETGEMVPMLENYKAYIRPKYEDTDGIACKRAEAIESAPPSRFRINTAGFAEISLNKYQIQCQEAERIRGLGLEVPVPEYAYITLSGQISVFPADVPEKLSAQYESSAFPIGFYDDETGMLVPDYRYKRYIDPSYKDEWQLIQEQKRHIPIPEYAYLYGDMVYVPENSSPYSEFNGSNLLILIGWKNHQADTYTPNDNYYRYFERKEGETYNYTDNHILLPDNGLLPIPNAAKQRKDGQYVLYARGTANSCLPHLQKQWLIGRPSNEPGMLIPFLETYQAALVEGAPVSFKDFPWDFKRETVSERRERLRQEEERRRQIEAERTMEEYNSYMYDIDPLASLIVIRYFEESGIDKILRSVYGPILAERIEHTAAVYAFYDTSCMDISDLGIDLYMRSFRPYMTAEMTDQLFTTITECGTKDFYDQWMALHENCDPVAFQIRHRVELYGSYDPDGWFFFPRNRSGVCKEASCVMFYDRNTEHYLYQRLQDGPGFDTDDKDPYANPIAAAPYSQLKNPQIFLSIGDSRYEDIPLLSKKYTVTACLDILDDSVKPIFDKYEKKLESGQYKLDLDDEFAALEPFEYKGVQGWLLIGVAPIYRSSLLKDGAKSYLSRFKQILENSTYSVTCIHPMAVFYDILPIDDDDDDCGLSISGEFHPRLSFKKNASKLFERTAGYYAVFTTNPELTRDELVLAHYQSSQSSGHFYRYINVNEYGDYPEHLRQGFPGNSLVCLIARSLEFYLWKKSATAKTSIKFSDMRSKLIHVSVCYNSGNPKLKSPLDKETKELMEHFGITKKDLIDFAKSCYADIDSYFAEDSEREFYDADIVNEAIERHKDERNDPNFMSLQQTHWF